MTNLVSAGREIDSDHRLGREEDKIGEGVDTGGRFIEGNMNDLRREPLVPGPTGAPINLT